MRIQTRLFLGTAALVLALMALQWWLYARQLRSIEDEVTRAATTVGTRVLSAERAIFGHTLFAGTHDVWVNADGDAEIDTEAESPPVLEHDTEVQVVTVPRLSNSQIVDREGKKVIRREFVRPVGDAGSEKIEWVIETRELDLPEGVMIDEHKHLAGTLNELPGNVRKLKVAVEDGEKSHDRYLVVSEDDQAVHRIPIPVSPAVRQVQETMREGAAMGGLLPPGGTWGPRFIGRFPFAVLRNPPGQKCLV